jgi:predicted phosphodiesterase
MSESLRRQVNRRKFLAIGLAAGGAVALRPPGVLGVDVDEATTRWALLSDTHVAADRDHRFRGFYPYHNLHQVAAEIADDLPDGVIITGDLARSRGRPAAYRNFGHLIAPIAAERPVYLALGNHDNRSNFLRASARTSDGGGLVTNKHISIINAGPVRMIVLDSLMHVRMFAGMLGRPQRSWLDTYLQICDDKPTILFIHHRPRADLLDARRLLEIAVPNRKVKAIVYGHSHRFRFSMLDDIHLINLPATGYNFTRSQPVGWVDARLTSQGGEFTLRALGGDKDLHESTTILRWRT